MAEIVAAALTSHAPFITGRPDIANPGQRDRLHAGFHELGRRLAAARPDLLVMFVNDHLQNFTYGVMPAFTCSSGHVSTGCEVIPTKTVSTPSSCDAPSIATR